MKNYANIFLFFIVLSLHFNVFAQNRNASEELFLQANNIVYVSGEEIGFKCTFISENEHPDNILFVDICGEGYILSSCILKNKNTHWEGFIKIPDSAQTGIYLMRAYLGDKSGTPTITSSLITIFNRFGNNEINELRKNKPAYQSYNYLNFGVKSMGKSINTYATKTKYTTLDTIQFWIENKLTETIGALSFSVFKTANEYNESPLADIAYSTHQISKDIKIYNNLTLSGKVIDRNTKDSKVNEMVLLSTPNESPQINFDYTRDDGKFQFQLNDYSGKQDFIIQTHNKNENLEIILYPLYLLAPKEIPYYISEEIENHVFSKLTVLRCIMNKAYKTSQTDSTTINKDKYPFYGHTTKRVYPEKYVPLNDFKEIAWEILPILKYKMDKDSTYLKIWDPVSKTYYAEPMLLVDGIPISDPGEINVLNSEKINWVEIQPQIRCYGDLLMKGVVSIQTKNGDFTDIELPYNSIRTEIETFYNQNNSPLNNSLFRGILFWEPELDSTQKVQQIDVACSYEKGKYIAIAQSFDSNGILNRSVFHFIVQ